MRMSLRLISVVSVNALGSMSVTVSGASSLAHKNFSSASGTKTATPLSSKGGKVLVNSKTYAICWPPAR